MKNKEMKEWLYRAGRTALQAAVGAIAANLVAWVGGVTDIASLKTVAISAGSVIVSAVLAALMNMGKDEE
uniref:Holin n=1 Tax=Siphoviridae sp. ct5Px37 TaxID=2826293 RepID=A0A8S5N3K7_9CAUD|nr:MAG TPA: holin [Siphoviridae sp. ct5Px37]